MNSIFGCDFTISKIKSTRGINGSLFKFNNKQIQNFDGIFLINTEGLSEDGKA